MVWIAGLLEAFLGMFSRNERTGDFKAFTEEMWLFVEQIKVQHEDRIRNMEADHERRLQGIREDYERKIAVIIEDYKRQIKDLVEDFERRTKDASSD